MKFSYSWLKDYLKELPSPEVLASDLTALGTEVEHISLLMDEKIIVAQILEIEPHPNADKLNIATVDTGEDKFKIVCGAPNIKVGQKVPLAPIGAKVEDNIIAEAQIRGQKSYGMLCSEKELGLGDNHTGILILDEQASLGSSLNSHLKNDVIFQVEVTPNRGDLLSHLGIARELGAKYGKNPTKVPVTLNMSSRKIVDELKVEVRDSKSCPKYFARVIKNVTIKQSPEWLKTRLFSLGLKPINNIVDVTNYIMLDLGQPLHAFDFDKVADQTIIVRKAEKDETILALDQKEYSFSDQDLVIADSKKAIALAGIIGGVETGITEQTVNVILEAAVFDPVAIRKSSKKLNISSDASYRFERGIDTGLVEYSINKAAELIKKTAGGSVLSGILKEEQSIKSADIKIDYDKINKLYDLHLTEKEIDQLLRRLGFEIKSGVARVPTYRHDIEIWQDLAEEVGRLHGLDEIHRLALPKSREPIRNRYFFKEWLKDQLTALGLDESISYPFVSDQDVSALGIDIKLALVVENPVQPENKYLRQSLFGGLAKVVARNSGFGQIYTFEIGEIFDKAKESTNLGIILASQNQKELNDICGELKKQFIEIKPELIDQTKFNYKFRKNYVYFCEVDLEKLKKYFDNIDIKCLKENIIYRPISKYPSVIRDIAIIVDIKVNANKIRESIFSSSVRVNRVELFDEYKSDKLGTGNKSLAFHIDLQDLSKTMTDEEAGGEVSNIISRLRVGFNAKLRE